MTWTADPTPAGWTFTDDTSKVSIVVDYIRPTSRGLDAWIELRIPDVAVPVSAGTVNLMSPTAIRPFVEDAKHQQTGKDWEAGLRLMAHTVVAEHRDGTATQDLSGVEPGPLQFLIEPLIEVGNTTRLIAAGGSGKSIFSLAIAMTVATGRRFLGLAASEQGPVLYIDYETDAATHARRITALRKPLKAKKLDTGLIHYRGETVPLYRSAQTIRRICDQLGVILVIVDSVRPAAGPSGQSSGEDAALNLYLGIREIGRTTLLIDHKSKDDIARDRRGGYGSVYYRNLARMEWEMTRLARVSNTTRSFVLELEKENNVGHLPPVGFLMELVGTKTGIQTARFELADPDKLADPTADGLNDRIAGILSAATEPMEVERIAVMLFGADEGVKKKATVRTRLNEDARFQNVGTGKVGLWQMIGLATDAGEQPPFEPPDVDPWDGSVY